VLFLTGPGENRTAILDGLSAIADEGQRSGVRVALEPIQREFADLWTTVSSLEEAAALIAESGADVGLMYDTWHLWNEPLEQIERHRDRIYGVHVADRREPTRNTNDRVLPGDGVIDFGPILEALRWEGLFDLEIFSDASCRDRSGIKTRPKSRRKASRSSGGRIHRNRLTKRNRSKFYNCRAGHTRGGAVKRTTRWASGGTPGGGDCDRRDRGATGGHAATDARSRS